MKIPRLMGILNVTPDSFSDGGRHSHLESAIAHAERLTLEGADLIDVGGESTRPGAEDVDAVTQIDRVLPVIRALVTRGIVVSVDTRLAEVARAACGEGASMVNDMSALGDSDMVNVLREYSPDVCLGHMRGTPKTMQENPQYQDVVGEVLAALLAAAERLGLARDKVFLDPGFGFGKTFEHNLELFRKLESFVRTGHPVLVGVSRKGFVGQLMDGAAVEDREPGNLVLHLLASQCGVSCIRTHEVKQTREALNVLSKIWT